MIAVFDIGSNGTRLGIYDVASGAGPIPSISLVEHRRIFTGMAKCIGSDGCLSARGVDLACDSLDQLMPVARTYGPQRTLAFATASLRNISNSTMVLAEVMDRTGLAIDLVSGEREAQLGFKGLLLDNPDSCGVMADIGGGSTEVVAFQDGKVVQKESLKCGSLRLGASMGITGIPTRGEYWALSQAVGKHLDDAGYDAPDSVRTLYGIGGTAHALCGLLCRVTGAEPGTAEFPLQALAALEDLLLERPQEARALVEELCPDRIDTMGPGIAIVCCIAQRFRVKRFQGSLRGPREGYLLEKLSE